VTRPSRSRMSRVLTMPGWTQLAVTLAFISLSRSASALVCRTLASLDSAYAFVGSYGLDGNQSSGNKINQSRRPPAISILNRWRQLARARTSSCG
jgi:hypothetical protein